MTGRSSDRPARTRWECWRATAGWAALLCGLTALATTGSAAATGDGKATAVAAATATAAEAAPLHLTTALHLVVDEGDAPLLATPARQLDWHSLPGVWQPIDLPQASGRPLAAPAAVPPARAAAIRTSWYRWQLPAPPAGDPNWTLYAARVRSAGPVAVYLDGQLVHVAQREGLRWTSARTPLWAALTGQAAGADSRPDAGPHDLLIGLRHWAPEGAAGATVDAPALSSVRVGTADALAWRDQSRRWLQMDLPALGSAAFLTVGLYSLVVWLLPCPVATSDWTALAVLP